MLTEVPGAPEEAVGFPDWIAPTLLVTPGRDPLGLQTITIDRIMPVLLPGILALSRRARYFSFYLFLLSEYQQRQMPPSPQMVSTFIKRREYEYALAVQLCPHGCGAEPSGVVGKQRAAPAAQGEGPFERGESVQSELGGYGLYYRTPLSILGLVTERGAIFAESEIPSVIDVLRKDDALAHELAESFRSAIAGTRYYRDYMYGDEPIPREVLIEYAEVACLCRLGDFPIEQELLRRALFRSYGSEPRLDVDQRRRSFAVFLSLVQRDPATAHSQEAFRRQVWTTFSEQQAERTPQSETLAQWAALVAKEYMQEGISSIWAETCREGLNRQGPEGLTRAEVDALLRVDLANRHDLVLPGDRTIACGSSLSATVFAARVISAAEGTDLEVLRRWAVERDTAAAGLAFVLALYHRLPESTTLPPGWERIGAQRSDHQPGLLGLGRLLADQLDAEVTVGELLHWLVDRFIIAAHESVAYSKLPRNTFRFRWERGRLRFYDLAPERFSLTDMRHDPLSQITRDLGMWTDEGESSVLTPIGSGFVAEVFP